MGRWAVCVSVMSHVPCVGGRIGNLGECESVFVLVAAGLIASAGSAERLRDVLAENGRVIPIESDRRIAREFRDAVDERGFIARRPPKMPVLIALAQRDAMQMRCWLRSWSVMTCADVGH